MRADWVVTPQLFLGANVLASAGSFARGDENNQDVNGQLPGYTLVNLDGRYLVTTSSNFGVVGENFFTGPDRSFGPAVGVDPVAEQFRGPGAPRGAWLGVRYSFGGRSPNDAASD